MYSVEAWKESGCAQAREDFSTRDDEKWMKHMLGASFSVSKLAGLHMGAKAGCSCIQASRYGYMVASSMVRTAKRYFSWCSLKSNAYRGTCWVMIFVGECR